MSSSSLLDASAAPSAQLPKVNPANGYVGRFAPSPTGPLHAGSLVAALASWLDARAHGGVWLVRIEDIDPPRCQAGADQVILQQLAQCGLQPDAPPAWQSERHSHYAAALQQLLLAGWAYPCGCSRKDIEAAWSAQGLDHIRHVERPYPGTCRSGLQGKAARSSRFALEKYISNWPFEPTNQAQKATFTIAKSADHPALLHWHDRRLGLQQQAPANSAGDFVLQRADGLYAYQLAVVVDDALQGITHVVRGEDLTDNTPRQMLLQHALGLQTPAYLHTPLVRLPDGEKLSKQHGAPAVDVSDPFMALNAAASVLGLTPLNPGTATAQALAYWVQQWRGFYNQPRDRYT